MNKKLGEFVRAHRDRIAPEVLGLPRNERRRTPGLRREELAALCGVSSTWITWLEQGRPVSASANMLTRLAAILRLSAAERKYLFGLAARVDPEAAAKEMDGANTQEARAIVGVIQAPAYILDRQWNAVAWNEHARHLFSGWLASESADPEHNLLRYMFLQSSARKFVVHWPERARRLVAEFRAECGKAVDTQPVKGLVDFLLKESKEFAQLWSAQDVVAREGGIRKFWHAVDGHVTFNQISLQLQGRPNLKLTILLSAS